MKISIEPTWHKNEPIFRGRIGIFSILNGILSRNRTARLTGGGWIGNDARVLRICISLLVLGALNTRAADYTLHTFTKQQLTDKFWSEGATAGDFNRDGKVDVAYGPYWWEGPDFTKRHEYRPATVTFMRQTTNGAPEKIEGFEGGLGVNNAYSDCFFMFAYDFNKDRWPDIFVYGFPGKEATWYENPGKGGGEWKAHVAFNVVDNESPGFEDVDGDGKPEITCCSGGYIGYVKADWKKPEAPWTFHPITPKGDFQRFTHGIGVGDVNGDGRVDFLEKDGWWEQPEKLSGDPVWKKHPFKFSNGGSQMFAYDVNGDGLNDVITAIEAHGYGITWYEQVRTNEEITFKPHVIVGKKAADNAYGVLFTQPHAMDLVDMDGDGIKDLVTGKRFWAHGSHGDADPSAPAVLYWFKIVRDGKTAKFVPNLIDNNSGVGTQVQALTVSNKKFPDVVVGNKKGMFIFKHETKKVSKNEWEAAQPKVASK